MIEEVDNIREARALSRRRFVLLAGSAMAAAAAMVPLGSTAAFGEAVGPVPIRVLDMAAFTAYAGQQFRVAGPAGPVIVTLIGVTQLQPSLPKGISAGSNASAFKLQFQASPAALLPQRTYTFQHARLGTFSLFIVPMGVTKGRGYYEAVFNRLPTSH